MTDRPIIMSAESVLAILDGRKTQTRRVLKFMRSPFGQHQEHFEWRQAVQIPGTFEWIFWDHIHPTNEILTRKAYKAGDGTKCPYEIGMKLWVKETHWFDDVGSDAPAVFYAATDEKSDIPLRSPIFMPRWASRITLAVVNVRVERLQDISEEDAMAEGVPGIATSIPYPKQYRDSFEVIWDAINAKRGYPWSSNPWVWIVEFKVQP